MLPFRELFFSGFFSAQQTNLMSKSKQLYTAVVLAGDRGPGDPLAMAAGVVSKALVPVGGIPMVLRVLDTLAAADEIGNCILCGPAESVIDQQEQLQARVSSGEVRWIPNQSTPSTSAYHVLQSLPDDARVLVTTADHALLSKRIVDHFCSEAHATGCDIVVGLASYERVMTAFPETRRTAAKLRDGAFCPCNLFAFLSPEARKVADLWRRVESQRKKPFRVMRILGWMAVLRYLLGRLSLSEAQTRISNRLGLRAAAVILPFPEAAVDVDTISDWKFVESIVAKQTL
jgi:CTP:molybdopterin cytidylyltransferase MocA